MTDKFILDGKTPVPSSSLRSWGEWMDVSNRKVASNEFDGVIVSTVFLGLDHSFGGETPILFETLVFNGPMDGEMERYTTWDEAEIGHAKMCERVKSAGKKNLRINRLRGKFGS